MAATKYQLLYRYMNESTNTPITNDASNEYIKTEEFYTIDHKIEASSDETVKIEGEYDKEEMISYGNNPANPKNNMIFAYDGTKKINHKKWIDEVPGCYVVRDWQSLDRRLIGNRGDYSKDFTTINGESPEMGGTVVCRNLAINKKYFPTEITVVNDNSLADAGTSSNPYYTPQKINSLITEGTIFELNTNGYEEHCYESNTTMIKSGYDHWGTALYTKIYIGPIAVGLNNMKTINTGYGTGYGDTSDNGLYSKMTIKPSQLKTESIPGHYEETIEYPYVIKDTYKRIPMTPWFVHATYGSLEAALEKAKILVDIIGLDNIKLIKLVPFDQFVKIK